MPMITMLDLAKRKAGRAEVGLIEANLSHAPELKLFPARTIAGTSYHTLLRTGLPSVSFTHLNEGVEPTKSTYENKLVECFPIRSLVKIDKAAVSADSPIGELQTDEAMGVTEATLRHVGRQIYYGRAAGKGDPKGFPGLQDLVANHMLLNATGDAADTGSSVYLIKFGQKDVQMVFGNNSVLSLPPFRDETARDANNKEFDASVSHLTGWAGLQCVNPSCVVRICNLTGQAGKGLTDALLAQAMDLFPAGITPDVIMMSGRSRTQLRVDRAGRTSAAQADGKKGTIGGGAIYAPTPTDFEGIPIHRTDSILNNEPIVA